ncbi:MAG: BrnT family toxin [Caldilineae bacterium]|nr:MAG: BrnT family toxin [Caldilineae bacterium]
MKFEWDEAKRQSNLRKHHLDFVDVETVFGGATFTFEDDRFEYGEDRYITLGLLRGMVVVIAHTEREDVIRVISMRKATRNEQKIYFEGFAN